MSRMVRYQQATGVNTIDGWAALNLMQNNEMPALDLLVRESVQNSLDAFTDRERPVKVSFGIHERDLGACIEEVLPEISDRLNARYPGNRHIIEIRDTGTSGLTGPVSLADPPAGNFVRLVYEIMKPQQQAGAGGAWGIGKTVYFRAGSGLVFFYSRIEENGMKESRLAAYFIENQMNDDRIMPDTDSGIAWWGGENALDQNGTPMPAALTEENRIAHIVKMLGIEPFGDDETGTSIVIPFLDTTALAIPDNGWYGNVAVYVRHSLYRWYASRLENHLYPENREKPALSAFLNGKSLSDQMPIVYRVVRALHNYALTGQKNFPEGISPNPSDCLREPIRLQETFSNGSDAGWIAAIRIDGNQLKSHDGEPTPHSYLMNDREAGPNIPIIGYLRSPGMIVSWNDAKWMQRLGEPDDGRYVLALFVPKSEQALRKGLAKETGCNTLEEYLRSREKADHASWSDLNNINKRIVENIATNCRDKVNNHFFRSRPDTASGTNAAVRRLARAFGDACFPRNGFGTDGRQIGGTKTRNKRGTTGAVKGRSASFTIKNKNWDKPGRLSVSWTLNWGGQDFRHHVIQLSVAGETGATSPREWNEIIETERFPFAFTLFSVDSITYCGKTRQTALITMPGQQSEYVEIKDLLRAQLTEDETAVELSSKGNNDGLECSGKLEIILSDSDRMRPVLVLKSEKEA